MEVMEYLEDNPHIVVNRFKHAGIHQALGMLNDEYKELPTYTDDSEYTDVICITTTKDQRAMCIHHLMYTMCIQPLRQKHRC